VKQSLDQLLLELVNFFVFGFGQPKRRLCETAFWL
jgi:hypothetical protein